jgi:hypothetical protein
MKALDAGMDLYNKLPSYDAMFYGFKPLRLSRWFTKEEINRIKKDYSLF